MGAQICRERVLGGQNITLSRQASEIVCIGQARVKIKKQDIRRCNDRIEDLEAEDDSKLLLSFCEG